MKIVGFHENSVKSTGPIKSPEKRDRFFLQNFLIVVHVYIFELFVIRMRKVAAGAKFWCRCKDMLLYQLKETKIESLTQIESSEWRPRVPRWRKKSSNFAKSL